jgi:hypothetical protein
MVLLTTKFLDVAKFTTLTPLSLLISCELSFPIAYKDTHALNETLADEMLDLN